LQFDQLIRGVQDGIDTYSRFIQGGNTSGRLTGQIGPFPTGSRSSEKAIQAAIAMGLNNQRNKTNTNPLIKTIWCPKNIHPYLNNITTTKVSIKPEWNEEEIAKSYDLAWSDRSRNRRKPDWYCQIKHHVSTHVKSAEGLSDLFWGLVDKKYLSKRHGRDVEMVFIWAEHRDYRENDRFLHFENTEGIMRLTLEPGYAEYRETPESTNVRFGNLKYENYGNAKRKPETYWWDRKNAVLHPNNLTAISRILGSVSNTSFYRQYRQHGSLHIWTDYKQLVSSCGSWHVYVHRLRSSRLTKSRGMDFFEWIP